MGFKKSNEIYICLCDLLFMAISNHIKVEPTHCKYKWSELGDNMSSGLACIVQRHPKLQVRSSKYRRLRCRGLLLWSCRGSCCPCGPCCCPPCCCRSRCSHCPCWTRYRWRTPRTHWRTPRTCRRSRSSWISCNRLRILHYL